MTVLRPNEKHSGIFLYGPDESQTVSGSIWLDPDEGVVAEIPFLDLGDGSAQVRRWFEDRRPPSTVLFLGDQKRISLFAASFARYSMGSPVSIGRLRFECAVDGEYTGSIADHLTVSSLTSELDALAYWTRLTSIDMNVEHEESRQDDVKVTYSVSAQRGLEWLQDDAKMSLQSSWRPDREAGRGVHFDDLAILKSRFKKPRPINDHLQHHIYFRDFLALIHGCGIYFRRHTVRDRKFPFMTLDRTIHGAESVTLISNRTIADRGHPEPKQGDLFLPILTSQSVTPTLLTRWARNYDEWSRCILPLVGVLRRSGLFAEDILVNASMSVEAAAHMVGRVSGESATYTRTGRPTTATHFYRLLAFSQVDFSEVSASNEDSAYALADTYNSVKHADRGPFPEFAFTYFAGRLALVLARVSMARLLAPGNPDIDAFASSWAVGRILHHMKEQRVRIDSQAFQR
jgi:hypothetical protein